MSLTGNDGLLARLAARVCDVGGEWASGYTDIKVAWHECRHAAWMIQFMNDIGVEQRLVFRASRRCVKVYRQNNDAKRPMLNGAADVIRETVPWSTIEGCIASTLRINEAESKAWAENRAVS